MADFTGIGNEARNWPDREEQLPVAADRAEKQENVKIRRAPKFPPRNV